MKQILIMACLMAVLPFHAQTDSLVRAKNYVALFFSPEYNYRFLRSSAANTPAVNYYNDTEVPGSGYTTGLKFGRHFKKRFAFDTGILFTEKSYRTVKSSNLIYLQPDPIIPAGSSIRFMYKRTYLLVPVKLNYYFLQKSKWTLYTSLGIYLTTNIFYLTKSFIETPTGAVMTYESGYSDPRFNFALSLGAGLKRSLSRKTAVGIEPVFTVMNSKFNSPIKTYIYSLGAEVGFYYHFD